MLGNLPAEIVYIICDYLDSRETHSLAVTCSRLHKLLAERVWQQLYFDLTKLSSRDERIGRRDLAQFYDGIESGRLEGVLESVKSLWIKVHSLDKSRGEDCAAAKLIEMVPNTSTKLRRVRIHGTVSSCPLVVAQIAARLETKLEVDVRVCLAVDTSWKGLLHSVPVVKNLTLKFQRDRYESGILLPDGIEDLSIYCNRISQKALTRVLTGLTTLKKLRIDTYSLVISSMSWLPVTVSELRLDLSEINYEGNAGIDRQRMTINSVTSLHVALLSLEPLEDVLFPNLKLLNIQNLPQHCEVLPTSTKTRHLWFCADVLLNRNFRNNHQDRFKKITNLAIYGLEKDFPYLDTLDCFPELETLHLWISTDEVDGMTWFSLQALTTHHERLKRVVVHAPDWPQLSSNLEQTSVAEFKSQHDFLRELGCDDESDLIGGPSYWIEDVI